MSECDFSPFVMPKELLQYYPINAYKVQNFTKGASIEVIFKSGKTVIGIVKRCNDTFADVQINNKEYLVNNNYQVLSQIK